MSLVDYGDRGVPNVFLEAPLTSDGPWNAARFHNKQYDTLVKQYVAARRPPDPATDRGQDRDPAAPGDAAHHPVLDRRADRVDAERGRR